MPAHTYTVIKVDSNTKFGKFETVNKYPVLWDYMYDYASKSVYQYSSEGYDLYILLRDDYKTVKPSPGHYVEGKGDRRARQQWRFPDLLYYPSKKYLEHVADDFGMSMLTVVIDRDGNLCGSMTRYGKILSDYNNECTMEVSVKQLNKALGMRYRSFILTSDEIDNYKNYRANLLARLKKRLEEFKKMYTKDEYKSKLKFIRWNRRTHPKWLLLDMNSYLCNVFNDNKHYPYQTYVDEDLNLISDDALYDSDALGDWCVIDGEYVAIVKRLCKYNIIDSYGNILSHNWFDEIYHSNGNVDGYLDVRMYYRDEFGCRCYMHNLLDATGMLVFANWMWSIHETEPFGPNKEKHYFDCRGYCFASEKDKGFNLFDENGDTLFDDYFYDISMHDGTSLKLEYDPTNSSKASEYWWLWLIMQDSYDIPTHRRRRHIFDYKNMRWLYKDPGGSRFNLNLSLGNEITITDAGGNFICMLDVDTGEKFDDQGNLLV